MRNVLVGILIFIFTNCATVQDSTQKIKIETEPSGARIMAIEGTSNRELGSSPLEYEKKYSSWHCNRKWAWLAPVGATLAGAALGGGLAPDFDTFLTPSIRNHLNLLKPTCRFDL